MGRDSSALRRSLYLRRGAGSIALIALIVGVLVAVAVVLMAWWLEPEPTRAPRRHRDIDVTELLAPDAPTTEERANASDVSDSASVLLEEGAWVQVADDEGKLKQQYSAERIEPLPDGWLEMERPRAMMYLGGGRVLSLRAEHGLLSAPDQAIESGLLKGDVVIRLFVPQHGEVVEIGTTPPAMIVRTEEAFKSIRQTRRSLAKASRCCSPKMVRLGRLNGCSLNVRPSQL
jgi:hypothetical protein